MSECPLTREPEQTERSQNTRKHARVPSDDEGCPRGLRSGVPGRARTQASAPRAGARPARRNGKAASRAVKASANWVDTTRGRAYAGACARCGGPALGARGSCRAKHRKRARVLRPRTGGGFGRSAKTARRRTGGEYRASGRGFSPEGPARGRGEPQTRVPYAISGERRVGFGPYSGIYPPRSGSR